MRRVGLVAALLLVFAATALAALVLDDEHEPPPPPRPEPQRPLRVLDRGHAFVLRNEDGRWTIEKRCRSGRGFTVGPGYVSRLVTRDGVEIVDDAREPGTLNDPEYGGLGAFAWHHARGRPGRVRFNRRNAWEISGRICARDNRGFGVVGSRVVQPPDARAAVPVLALDVLLSDGFTWPRPLVRLRYRYELHPSALRSRITVTQLCARGRCGTTSALAFVKEPKLVAHVTGGGFTRMATFDGEGKLVCVYTGAGPPAGPILETGQCGADGRERLRFDHGTASSGADGRCDERSCLDILMRSEDGAWEGGAGLDRWAVAAAGRPAADGADTGSIDGVLWGCHGGRTASPLQRRWETAARAAGDGRRTALGGLFPAWEGGRGGYDCEPLARTFGPHGESFTVVAIYDVGEP